MKLKISLMALSLLVFSCAHKNKKNSQIETPVDSRIAALQKENEMIVESIHDREMDEGVFLSLDIIRTIDDQNIYVGGAYSAGGLLRSALFVSQDSGKTWNEVEAYVYGSSVSDLQIKESQVNAFLTYGIEGAFFNGSLRSFDAGKNWFRYEGQRDEKTQDKIRAHIGCCFEQVYRGEFKDDKLGYALIGDYRYLLLKTQDGGLSYEVDKLLGDAKKKIPDLKVFSNKKAIFEYRIKESSQKNSDGVSLTLEIQKRKKGTQHWLLLSEIPTLWIIDKTTLKTKPKL